MDIEPDNTQASTDNRTSAQTNRDVVFADSDAGGTAVSAYSGDTSDEIDPRDLLRDPTLDELRWYYRRTFARRIVNKPIDDSFKNGFELKQPEDGGGVTPETARKWLSDANFVENYTLAQKKARRDGFALLFIGFEDHRSLDVSDSPLNEANNSVSTSVTHTSVFTVDDLSSTSRANIKDEVIGEFDGVESTDDYDVRERTGIVINTNPLSAEFRQPLGYVLDNTDSTFIHRDRVMHFVWNQEVDGPYGDNANNVQRFGDHHNWLGRWEGDSILTNSYDLMKGLTKGNWSVMQALYRNAANMYAVWTPDPGNFDEDEWDDVQKQVTNLNAKSEMIFPGGPPSNNDGSDVYDMKQFESGGQLEPQEYFDVIFDQLCASHELTKSVLFGTQSGTVSGSEVDIKNYFNKVDRFRKVRASEDIRSFIELVKSVTDGRTNDDFTTTIEAEWGPMFDLDADELINALSRFAEGMNAAVNGYLLTPDEARSILANDWASTFSSSELEELEDLTDEQVEILEDLNQAQTGRDPDRNDPTNERTGDPVEGNQNPEGEGGMPEGTSTSDV
jgi:hypothetical protein